MANSIYLSPLDITVTPVFKHITVEDVQASEREKRMVMKTMEVVEVRFAGAKHYAPVFPVTAQWAREGNRTITYAERWADQYRDFLEGNEQRAAGTPLELLKQYGITESQLSLCRVLKIYSIEALHSLEGPNLKNLAMNAGALKDMARKYMADRSGGESVNSELAALRAEIERLKAAQSIPAQEPTPQEVDEVIQAADDEYAALSDEQLKDAIAAKTGTGRPRGNPGRATLVQSLRELESAA